MNYAADSKSGRSEYRYSVGWVSLVVLMAGCASSHRANTREDSNPDFAMNDRDSSDYAFDSDADTAERGFSRVNNTPDHRSDGSTDWIDHLNEWIDTRSNADTQLSTTEIEIEAASPEMIPIGQWLGQTWEVQDPDCDQTKRVVIQIAPSNEKESVLGLVTFGDRDPPPPAVDPEVGYPPGFASDPDAYDLACPGMGYLDGFPYSIRNGRFDQNGRFTFRIAVKELYQTWCSLQTSYNVNGYSCTPPLNLVDHLACGDQWSSRFGLEPPPHSVPIEDHECPIDLGKFVLCTYDLYGPCNCNDQGCVAAMDRVIRFDLLLEQETMQGIITDLTYGWTIAPAEVRLRRVD